MRVLGCILLITCVLAGERVGYAQSPAARISAFYNSNQRDSALLLVEEYIPRYEKEEKWDSLVLLQRLKATIYSSVKSQAETQAEFDKAEKWALQHLSPHELQYIMVMLRKGDFLSRQMMYAEAEEYLDQAISLASEVEDTMGIRLTALDLKSWNLWSRKKYDEALEVAYQIRRENIKKPSQDTFLLMSNARVLGSIYEHLSRLDSTFYYKKMSMEYMKQLFPADHVNIGISYVDMMGVFYENFEMDKALEYIETAEQIFEKDYYLNGNTRYLSVAFSNKALIYNELGEYALAAEFQEKAVEMVEREYGNENPFLVTYYTHLADMKMNLSSYEEALIWLDKAMNIVQSGPSADEEMERFVETYFSRFYLETDQLEEATNIVDRLYHFYLNKNELFSKRGLNVTRRLAELNRRKGDLDEAIFWLDENRRISDSVFAASNQNVIFTLVQMMEIYMEKGKDEQVEELSFSILDRRNNGAADRNIKTCIPAAELLKYAQARSRYLEHRIRDKGESADRYFTFLEDFEVYYNDHLSIIRSDHTIAENAEIIKEIYRPGIELMAVEDPEMVLLLSEKIKSFLTRLSLQSQLIPLDGRGKYLQNRVNQLLAQSMEDSTETQFMEAGRIMEEFTRYKDSLHTYDADTYYRSYGFRIPNRDDILGTLNTGEVLIEYTVLDSVIFIISYHGGLKSVSQVNRSRVYDLLVKCVLPGDREVLRELYELLIPEEVRTIKNYFIIPDGELLHFNFEQLLDAGGEFLIYSKNIRYAYSAIVYQYQKQLGARKKKGGNILAMTPGFSTKMKDGYLDYYPEESVDSAWLYFIQQPFLIRLAQDLDKYHQTKNLLHHAATEDSFKKQAKDYRVIHLGTHGVIDEESPLFSRLIFAKDSIEDGYLHTYEIYGQEMEADLAVLMACETGAGSYTTGEGVVSLAHAFTHAGCPAVLMSLWKIDEKSSAEIIRRFYGYLHKGKRKSLALKLAKLDYLKNAPRELQDPYYWAGMIIMGNDVPVYSSSSGIWWLSAIFIIITGLVFVYLRR